MPEVVVPLCALGFIYFPQKLDFVYFITVQPYHNIMCAYNRVHYGPMVVFTRLHIRLLHYHHYKDLSEGIGLLKCLSGNSVTSVCLISYHGYAMRKILPLCIKTVTGKSKGFLCLFGHNSRIHCFCLKNLNLFSQNITFRVINYLNLVEKINRNWNVDEVSVPIISKDIR